MKSIPLIAALLSLVAAAPAPVPHVSTQRMSEITRVLASDEFQGRAPGTPGEEKTIPYLIEQFKAAGLEPAGENGGWTQTVPMIRTQLQAPCEPVRQPRRPDAAAQISRRPLSRHGPRRSTASQSPTRRWCSSATASPRPSAAGTISRASTCKRQGRRHAGQRSRLRGGGRRAGRGQVRRQDDDLLRPLGLQVRGGGAARRDRRAGRPRDARPRAIRGTW